MATVILQNGKASECRIRRDRGGLIFENSPDLMPLERICSLLPSGLAFEIRERLSGIKARGERVEEIRMRAGSCAYLTVGGASGRRNLALDSMSEGNELESTLKRMCDGSLYSYSESIIKGYVSMGGGIRVGVCGRAATESKKILGVYAISSLNIRLPCGEVWIEPRVLGSIRRNLLSGSGVLVYSPPAEGKTTFLRSLAAELSSGEAAMRTALVDSRDELELISPSREQSADRLVGYPKAEAIGIATAFMSPEVIICDEIGGDDDIKAICEAQNCGVPLVASAHGERISSLLRRPSMLALHRAGAFGLYVGIRISEGELKYTLHSREEADRAIENSGDNNACIERRVSLLAKD